MAFTPSETDKTVIAPVKMDGQGDNFQGERLDTADILRTHQEIAANERAVAEIKARLSAALDESGLRASVVAGFPDHFKNADTHPLYAHIWT